MKTHINNSVADVLMELFQTKKLTIDFEYNEETESLDIKGVVMTNGGEE
jgi:hypothetical protein